MLQVAGKSGHVIGVDSDGDVKVEVSGNRWILNPECCILESIGDRKSATRHASSDANGSDSDEDEDDDDDGSRELACLLLLVSVI